MSTHSFTPAQVESLIRLVESSVEVRRRYQFYLWIQGDLQRLMPHKLAACGAYDHAQRDLVFDVLNSVQLAPELIAALNQSRSVTLSTLMADWQRGAGLPVWVDLAALAQQDVHAQGLLTEGYRHLLVHGVTRPGRPHELETFFVLGSPGATPDPLAVHAMQLFMPYLHSTYLRVFTNECELASPGRASRHNGVWGSVQGGGDRPRMVLNLTEREREILRWVRDGLSNQQISVKLGISALTVKNHVQKILRKLGAANRAQAVAKAMTVNALSAVPFPLGERL